MDVYNSRNLRRVSSVCYVFAAAEREGNANQSGGLPPTLESRRSPHNTTSAKSDRNNPSFRGGGKSMASVKCEEAREW